MNELVQKLSEKVDKQFVERFIITNGKSRIEMIDNLVLDILLKNNLSESKEPADKEDILQALLKIIDERVNNSILLEKKFNYEQEREISLIHKLINIKEDNNRKKIIGQSFIDMDRSAAMTYLPIYEAELEKIKIILKENSSRTKLYRDAKKLNENYEKAIKMITGTEDRIKILFPPNVMSYVNSPEMDINLIPQLLNNKEGIKKSLRINSLINKKIKNLIAKNCPYDNILKIQIRSAKSQELKRQVITNSIQNMLTKIEPLLSVEEYNNEQASQIAEFRSCLRMIRKEQINIHDLDYIKLNDKLRSCMPSYIKQSTQQTKKRLTQIQQIHHKFNGLSANEYVCLHLFEKVFTKDSELSELEKKLLAHYLTINFGNMPYNNNLTKFSRNVKNSAYDNVSKLKYWLYKTNLVEGKIDYIIRKAEKVISEPDQGHDKLSLKEVGLLYDINKLHDIFSKLHAQNITHYSSKLRKMKDITEKANELIEKIENQANFSNQLKDGDIIMTLAKKNITFHSRQMNREELLTTTLVSKYTHAATIFINQEDKKATLSHVYGDYRDDTLTAYEYMDTDIFRLNPYKLLTTQGLKILHEQHPNRTDQFLINLYRKQFYQLQEERDKNFSDIENDVNLRYKAGYADFKYKGHYDKNVSYERIYKEMSGIDGFKIKNKMICSEFAARNIAASVYKLNQELQDRLNTDIPILKMPFDHENFERIHPQRLIGLLEDTGALEIAPKNDYLSMIIDHDKLAIKNRTIEHTPVYKLYGDFKKYRNLNLISYQKQMIDSLNEFIMAENINIDLNDEAILNKIKKEISTIYVQDINPSILIKFLDFIRQLFSLKPLTQLHIDHIVSLLEVNQDSIDDLQLSPRINTPQDDPAS